MSILSGQRGALLAASMNLKSSQASFSSSSSSAADVNDAIVGTHSMVSDAVSPAGILVLSFKTLIKLCKAVYL